MKLIIVFYHHNTHGKCIYLVVYVDDIVITGDGHEGIMQLKQHLLGHLQPKDLGKLNYFLVLKWHKHRHCDLSKEICLGHFGRNRNVEL